MDQIMWCLQQKKGLELVTPSDNLRVAYLKMAEESLETMRASESKNWKMITAYYTIYQGLYSLLMRLGVKCEIHSCTIEFAKRFLKNFFSSEEFELVEKAYSARIDSQYYVDRSVPNETYDKIKDEAPRFLVKCKNVVLKEADIDRIREKLSRQAVN